MRRTEPVYDDAWAIGRLREVWEWAVAKDLNFIAYLIGMAILAFDIEDQEAFKLPGMKDAATKTPKRSP